MIFRNTKSLNKYKIAQEDELAKPCKGGLGGRSPPGYFRGGLGRRSPPRYCIAPSLLSANAGFIGIYHCYLEMEPLLCHVNLQIDR